MIMTKDIVNFNIIVITQAIEALQIICVTKGAKDKEVLAVLHNGSNYDYHFIMESWQKNLKGSCMLSRKYRKVHNIFCTNTKRT